MGTDWQGVALWGLRQCWQGVALWGLRQWCGIMGTDWQGVALWGLTGRVWHYGD